VYIWNVASGGNIPTAVKHHAHYVQGVAWSPCGKFIASQSSDRTCAIQRQGQGPTGWETAAELSKLPNGRNMFCDEDCPTFFRRLCFSPEGSLLFCPTGTTANETEQACKIFSDAKTQTPTDSPQHCALVMCQGSLDSPALQLPGFKKPVIAIRCCPVLFTKKDGPSVFDLPYRIVYAVASQDTLTIFDTQHEFPICHVSGLHYHHISDIAWTTQPREADSSSPPLCLVVCSADGFCSFVRFGAGELGELLETDKLPAAMTQPSTTAATHTAPIAAQPIQVPAAAKVEGGAINQPAVRKKKARISPTLVGNETPVVPTSAGSSSVSPKPACSATPDLGSIQAGSVTEKKDKKRRIAPMLVSPSQQAPPAAEEATHSIAQASNTPAKQAEDTQELSSKQPDKQRRRISPQLVTPANEQTAN